MLPVVAQTTTYYAGAVLDVRQATGLVSPKDYGIKATAAGGTMTVRMFNIPDFQYGNVEDGLIYGAYSDRDDVNNYVHKPWMIDEMNWLIIPFVTQRASTKYQPVLSQLIRRAAETSADFVTWSATELEVTVELELSGDVTIDDLAEIRLPGGIVLKTKSFISDDHYCASHPSDICCQALAQMRNMQDERVIINAHRGFYGEPRVVENSMGSLQRADELDYVLIEMDLMETKDSVLILNHDKGPYRVMDVSNVAKFAYGTDPDKLSYVNYKDLYYHSPNPGMFDGGLPLKEIRIKDRYGNVVDEKLKTITDAILYIKDKDILLKIDPKLTNDGFDTYASVIKRVLELGIQYDCLHQLIFTVLSLNNNVLLMMPDDMEAYLGPDLWADFSTKSNINVVVYEGNADYVKEWAEIPAVVTYEVSFRQIDYENDPLIMPKAELGNMNIMQYVNSKGIKFSVFQQNPMERRGTGDNGEWRDVYTNTFQGSWEHITRVNRQYGKIGTYTADRSVMLQSFFEALGIFSPKTFRENY